MARARASASLALATALAGSALTLTVAVPIAHADSLDNIRAAVYKDRAASGCPPLTYSGALEAAAQKYARSINPADSQPPGYNGKTLGFFGGGDPLAAAINDAYTQGAGRTIGDCQFTEFGVGFVRIGNTEDSVTIVFGAPTAPPPPPSPVVLGPPVVVPDPPAAQPPPVVAAPAPTDAVRVSFDKGAVTWTVNVTNTASIPGKCTYAATASLLPGVNKSFNVGANGSTSFTVPAPPLLSTYHVVTSCRGTFNGQNVEFGHDEQDVSSG